MSRHAFYFVVDRNYYPICEVVCQRLLKLFDADIHIFLEDARLSELPLQHLESDKVHRHLNLLSPLAPQGLPTDANWPEVVYLRIFAPHFLSEYDRIVYLDTDIMPVMSNSFIWEVPLPNGVGCVHDCAVYGNAPLAKRENDGLSPGETKKKWLESIGVNQWGYFNSGVLIIEPKIWIGTDWARALTDYVTKYRDLIAMFDQDFLNCILQGCWTELSPRYNFQYSIMNFGLEEILKPVFAHFSSRDKPWYGRHDPVVYDMEKVAFDFFSDGLVELGYDPTGFLRPQKRDFVSRLKIRLRRELSEKGIRTGKERRLLDQWSIDAGEVLKYLNDGRVEGRFADKIPVVSINQARERMRFDGKKLRSVLNH